MVKFIKKLIIPVITISLISGCTKVTNKTNIVKENTPSNNSEEIKNGTNKPSNTTDSGNPSEDTAPETNNNNNELLKTIMELAKEGKIIDCDFAAKSTTVEDVTNQWGEPESSDWIPSAKGTYVTYPSYNVAFGFNKGSQIFEVRSFNNKIKVLSLDDVKKVYGTPDYDITLNDEEIIGYVVNDQFKILIVFPQPTKEKSNPFMNHYSVFYPRGTVNNMADDPGREW